MWSVHAFNVALVGFLIWTAVQFPESDIAFWLAIAGATAALGLYAFARAEKTGGAGINLPIMDEVYLLPKEEQRIVFQRVNPLLYLLTASILLMMSWISFASQGTLERLTAEQAVLVGVVLLMGMETMVLWGWYAWFTNQTTQQIRAAKARRAAAPEDDTPEQRLIAVEGLGTGDPLPGIRPLAPVGVQVVHAVNIGLVVLLVGAVVLLPEQWPDTLVGALIGLPCAGLMYVLTWIDKKSQLFNMWKKPLILALPAAEQEALFQRADMLLFGFATLILLMGVAILSPDALAGWATGILTALMVVGAFAHHRWFASYLNERLVAYEDYYGVSEAVGEEAAA